MIIIIIISFFTRIINFASFDSDRYFNFKFIFVSQILSSFCLTKFFLYHWWLVQNSNVFFIQTLHHHQVVLNFFKSKLMIKMCARTLKKARIVLNSKHRNQEKKEIDKSKVCYKLINHHKFIWTANKKNLGESIGSFITKLMMMISNSRKLAWKNRNQLSKWQNKIVEKKSKDF